MAADASRWPAVETDPLWGCWLWKNGKTNGEGYPVIWIDGKAHLAHRHVYEAHVGPVPEGKELDHLCSRPLCVRPAHLEPVTRSTNLRRRAWKSRVRIAKCQRGHDMHLNAMVLETGGRVCRICSRSDQP